ncbi:Thiamine-phosphate synthase [Pontiella desulfatans]|uniref:Thiamine-phosphate synthase n=1 Tax=Pontiella desulfatans TaxID=2750659 RepID=A0A6C2TW40_PONDE|nr:thiamine phosphate synthase [Pontiella desulfatans]VGO11546.1 Thiamine-phosphate synthase [Pontiella desulfatans]
MKENFGLYLILTDPVSGYEAAAKAAVECGVRYLQLRMKNTPREQVAATALALRDITKNTQTRFIVNDDLTVAIESDADGIHLGQADLSVEEARSTWSVPGKIFGLSTHSLEQALLAAEAAPDYIGVGPVHPTPTKADADPALGAAEVGRIIGQSPLTAVAIGGINAQNLPGLLEAGAQNYCVVSAVNAATDPAAAIRALQKIWERHVF